MRVPIMPAVKSKIGPGAQLLSVPAATLVVAIIILHSVPASAQAAPTAATVLAPPSGNTAFLMAHGAGTQNYTCQASAGAATGTVWTFQHPQATLSIPGTGPFRLQVGRDILPVLSEGAFKFEVADHFQSTVPGETGTASPGCIEAADGQHQYCPTWISPHDQSQVWGTAVATVTAGTSQVCPNADAVACLLLKSAGNSAGQADDGLFARATFIQRTNTAGGVAPALPCTIGRIEFVPYTADYTFYKAAE